MIFEVPDTFGITWCTSSDDGLEGDVDLSLDLGRRTNFSLLWPNCHTSSSLPRKKEHSLGRTERISQPSGSRGGLTMPCFFLVHCSSFSSE